MKSVQRCFPTLTHSQLQVYLISISHIYGQDKLNTQFNGFVLISDMT